MLYTSDLQGQGVLQVLKVQPDLLFVLVGANRGKAIKVTEWLPDFAQGLENGMFVDNGICVLRESDIHVCMYMYRCIYSTHTHGGAA